MRLHCSCSLKTKFINSTIISVHHIPHSENIQDLTLAVWQIVQTSPTLIIIIECPYRIAGYFRGVPISFIFVVNLQVIKFSTHEFYDRLHVLYKVEPCMLYYLWSSRLGAKLTFTIVPVSH